MGKRKPGSKKHAPLPQKISNKVGGATTTKQKKTTKPKPKAILSNEEKKDILKTTITAAVNAGAKSGTSAAPSETNKKAAFDFGSLLESLNDDSMMTKTAKQGALSVEVKGLKAAGPLNSKTTKHFNGKKRQKLEKVETDQFMRVASLPSFKANPLDAIRDHLENQLK